jgi:hypothetical protein
MPSKPRCQPGPQPPATRIVSPACVCGAIGMAWVAAAPKMLTPMTNPREQSLVNGFLLSFLAYIFVPDKLECSIRSYLARQRRAKYIDKESFRKFSKPASSQLRTL